MKKFYIFVLILVLPFVLMACSVPAAEGTTPGQVNEAQFYVIGLIASGVLYGLKILGSRFPKWVISREALSIFLYVLAWVVSLFWGGITIPEFGAFTDPVTFVTASFAFLTALLIAFSPSVAFATLIYNILLKRVFDGWAGKG